jgi:hypothetical protein
MKAALRSQEKLVAPKRKVGRGGAQKTGAVLAKKAAAAEGEKVPADQLEVNIEFLKNTYLVEKGDVNTTVNWQDFPQKAFIDNTSPLTQLHNSHLKSQPWPTTEGNAVDSDPPCTLHRGGTTGVRFNEGFPN